jgi:poly-gamma-glutamate synthesis protein (capsule biosynthesis protein)
MKKGKVLIIQLSLAFLLLIGTFIFAFIYPKADSSDVFIEESVLTDTIESSSPEQAVIPPVVVSSEEIEEEAEEETEEAFQDYDITLMSVGDNLLHMGVIETGKQTDGTYNYSFLFDGISDFLDYADIKMINQETILGGNQLGFSGFPAFNSPTEVGDAIASAGFNVVLQASNHSADKKLEGIKNCAAFWKTYPEILLTGIHESTEGSEVIPVLTIDDVTFAVLNYTYGPNMATLPSSIEGHLNILCHYDENNLLDFTTINPNVLEDIAYAETIADVVIVCPHWGNEYVSEPSSYQKKFAEQMTEAGADLIIGTHPHVVQPVQWVSSENGNRALCFYSLGNYVSTQKKGLTMLEAMAWVTFRVTEDGVTISDKNTGVIPMVCQYTSGPVRFENVYALEDYTDELAASHGIHSYGGVNLKLTDLQEWSREILGDWVLSKAQVLSRRSEKNH